VEKQTILVVDDTPENIDILVGILKTEYKVKAAPNGEKALKVAEKSPPDLILLDIMMPVMDGFETCKRLKDNPELKEIPIIFLTAKTETEDIVKGFDLGAVDYLTKPFNPLELKVRVNTHLQLRKSKQELESKNEQLERLADKLSKYLSADVYQSIFTGNKDVKLETERKSLTVFFSDIVQFTETSEKMSHTELTAWLNGYLNRMAEIAAKYEGTLDKFIGDAIMIFFGDPKSSGVEEDARRCVRMATEMQTAAREMKVDLRMGIHSGNSMVGNFGSENRMDYTIIGKTVNLASRLETNAEINQILISDSTYELIKDEIACEQRGNIRVKGIDRDILTYYITV
jgi:adenylate cyclase